ncbi:MAG: response regulator [Candidatus Methanoperedens sp.]|jgi:two-component system cell cycle response regulator DivK|nr:response regulator [Candidatus Methanoperedens sp.]PKL53625.1 MAG: two-component system response regulator [Candidatus Methanoperedenaceae archaeon HGW-Methanoperedenaceae-1]
MKVLVVEDNPLNMELLQDVIELAGFTVHGAGSGGEAVEMAQKETYDLIVMDIGLPDIDGIETARLIRSRPEYKNTPIIAVTAFAMPGDRKRFLASGFTDYLPKPVDIREFTNLLGKYKK